MDGFIRSTVDVPLMNNTLRGFFVEHLIAAALGKDWSVTGEWDSWDLSHISGHRVEVKQTSLVQPWHVLTKPKSVRPSFSIASKKGYWSGVDWIEKPGRPADTYIFALHHEKDLERADHRDPTQWSAFIVPEIALPQQSRISLSRVERMSSRYALFEIRNELEKLFR